MYWWARQYPVTQAAAEAETSEKTATDVYQWLREICGWRLLNFDDCRLGGPGAVIQIDESLFRHKPKVKINNTKQLIFKDKHIVYIIIIT